MILEIISSLYSPLILAWWHHIGSNNVINTGSDNDLSPDSAKPLSESIVVYIYLDSWNLV